MFLKGHQDNYDKIKDVSSYLKSLICNSYMLISEKECKMGFSFARFSHPSGFNSLESRLSRKVRLPSDESLLNTQKEEVKTTNHSRN